MEDLPDEADIVGPGTECIALRQRVKASIAEHNRKRAFLQDQHNLSAFMKAISGHGEMTDELERWWTNRY